MTERESLERIVKAWESLPGGRYYSEREIENWLVHSMAPAIDVAPAATGDSRRTPCTRLRAAQAGSARPCDPAQAPAARPPLKGSGSIAGCLGPLGL